jgi:hypothetical protein
MIKHTELELTVACFKVVSWDLSRKTEKNHEKTLSEQPMLWPISEMGTHKHKSEMLPKCQPVWLNGLLSLAFHGRG